MKNFIGISLMLVSFVNYGQQFVVEILTIDQDTYFQRIDEWERQIYLEEYKEYTKALEYFEMGDYESAIYWAKECNYPKYDWNCTIYPIITLSYANLEESGETRRWFKRLERFCGEPETIRKVRQDLRAIRENR